MTNETGFKFNISLSVLNHLGRNLYRNFITILGEAIANSWDADAKNIWIDINKADSCFVIKDDGVGMNKEDFQEKFLKVGYSKRKESGNFTENNRPFLGRKGIGKLALLSCSAKVSIISKREEEEYVGGVINNEELDKAIDTDKNSNEYTLDVVDDIVNGAFQKYTKNPNHEQGTIILFEEVHAGIKNSLEHLKKLIALSFNFSLIDKGFTIHVKSNQDKEYQKVGVADLSQIINNTQFLWSFGNYEDEYTKKLEENIKEHKPLNIKNVDEHKKVLENIKGYIASTNKPKDRSLYGGGKERVTIDLFVNGRLREKNIVSRTPTSRIAENYFYGQIHYNVLDDGSDSKDRFNSSREGVLDDEKVDAFFIVFEKVLNEVVNDWDELRRNHKQDGNPDKIDKITPIERKAEELINKLIADKENPYSSFEEELKDIRNDANYNVRTYIHYFLIENLLRKYCNKNEKKITDKLEKQIETTKVNNDNFKKNAGLKIDIRVNKYNDYQYLDMDDLSKIIEGNKTEKDDILKPKAKPFSAIRNAVAHTSTITEDAQTEMQAIFNNIKEKMKALFNTNK